MSCYIKVIVSDLSQTNSHINSFPVLISHCTESQHCSALLEGAVHILLCCLETVDVDPATTKDYFAWKLEGEIKWAHFLRRNYEEVCVYI